ncbi:MAG: hypothetical protein ACNA7W_03520 [Pseudomonadales bacterium]
MLQWARVSILLAGVVLALPAAAELRFHFEDQFAAAERVKLTAWVTETAEALASLVGEFPFDVHVHLYRRDGASQPVPWAHTRRGRAQGVHLHVDPRFPLEDFRRDWTAPHELGHLVLPYLGSSHAWFAEGFASYLQYEVMIAMGVLGRAEANGRYRERIERARQRYGHPQRPFAAAAPRLRAEGNYPTMYWGGAVYFLNADAALRQRGRSGLISLLRDYLACCRSGYATPRRVARDLDRLSASTLFETQLERFEQTPGFPDWPL